MSNINYNVQGAQILGPQGVLEPVLVVLVVIDAYSNNIHRNPC